MIRLKVKEIAEEKGFNQSSLSRTANVSFNTVKRIFRNPYRETTTTILAKLSKALGVSSKDLIEDVVDSAETGDKNTFKG